MPALHPLHDMPPAPMLDGAGSLVLAAAGQTYQHGSNYRPVSIEGFSTFPVNLALGRGRAGQALAQRRVVLHWPGTGTEADGLALARHWHRGGWSCTGQAFC
jgi:hypothetical protein